MYYIDVIIPIPFSGETFTYSYSRDNQPPKIGVRVNVPLASKEKVAIVVAVHQTAPNLKSIKEIGEIVDPTPILTPSQIEIMRWVASYYLTPVGLVLMNYLPKAISSGTYQLPTLKAFRLNDRLDLPQIFQSLEKRKAASGALNIFLSSLPEQEYSQTVSLRELNHKGISPTGLKQLIERGVLIEQQIERRRFTATTSRAKDHAPHSEESETLFEKIQNESRPVLLYDQDPALCREVIGRMVEENSTQRKLALVVLPDSYSAPTMVEALGDRFEIIEHHARISAATRNKNYYRLLNHPQSVDVVVGTRSALMLPLTDLALVIVIQENDFGHKATEKAPLINGRDLAMVVAAKHKAKTILTTTAPSLEGYAMCKYRRWAKIDVGQKKEVAIKLLEKGKKQLFSSYMIRRISETLEQGNQVVVLQNRRGFASSLFCNDCGYTPLCQRCNVSLSIHQSSRTMQCHYCGYTTALAMSCGGCGSANVSPQGMGTERIVEDLSQLFPLATISRVDSDSITRSDLKAGSATESSSAQADIIVGTQLLVRGLTPQRVMLGVVVNADNLFLSTDFRTSERAMVSLLRLRSMIGDSGELVLQSWNIENPVLRALSWDRIGDYYERELVDRRELGYPPVVRLIILRLYGRRPGALVTAAQELDRRLALIFGDLISPPYEPVVDRVQERYILEIMVRFERDERLESQKGLLYSTILDFRREYSWVEMSIDVDPL
ncbi:MAG: primosomal protein N' [Rikenellaceae bacterium]